MATNNGPFEFTVGSEVRIGELSSGVFVDGPTTSVTFTFSVSGNPPFAPGASYQPSNGIISVGYGITPTTSGAFNTVLSLTVSNTNGYSKFDDTNATIIARNVTGDGAWKVTNNSVTFGTLSAGNLTVTGALSGAVIRFIHTGFGDLGILTIESITATVNCFTAGTRIETPDGPRAVENLTPGDRILTADGRETTVKWLGEQAVDVRLTHPRKVNPICISAGAIADGVPARDLWVSQDHAIAIDGMLINAGALVNGSSIYQVAKMPLDGFTYYHVETDAHELLLAEGCAAETFIDYAGRDSFVNGNEAEGLIAEMPLPRISAARLVPEDVRTRLAKRAETLVPQRRVA